VVTDEKRSIEYAFALHIPREISNLALSLGGKPAGGLGVWNAPYTKQVLGEEKISEFRRRKAELDPKCILNPGMWLDPPLFLKTGVYQFAMQALSILDRFFPTSVGKAEGSGFAREVASCVQCGYCMTACPTNQGWISSTPRGRILKAKELFRDRQHPRESITREYVDRVFQCTLCGRCKVDCTVEINSPQIWMDLRKCLWKRGFKVDGLEVMRDALDESYNIAAKPNEQRANWVKKLTLPYSLMEKKQGEAAYFVGCVTSFFAMTQPIARSFAQILEQAGVDFIVLGGDEWCCGFPLLAAGMPQAAEKYIRHNIAAVRERGVKSVITTCPGCYRVWKHEYQDVIESQHPFEVLHSTEFIALLIEAGKLNLRGLEDMVTYHDPCDLGRKGGVFDEPRYILEKIPGLEFKELENHRQYCNCCGSGGDLLITHQELSLSVAGRKVEEVLSTGAETLVTACPSCIRAINMAKTREKANFNVLDVTQLVWKSMGG
jgi:Fe-S oxidoreductase